MCYKLFFVLEQARKFLSICLVIIWLALLILCCEPPVILEEICRYTLQRIVIVITVISWWILAYIFCDYPLLTSMLFFLASLSTLSKLLFVEPRVRKSIPAGFSGMAYANLAFIDASHLEGLLHLSHFGLHLLLMTVAIYSVLSLDPAIRFVKTDHQRVLLAEIIVHTLMGFIEPVYWILVIQNVIELWECYE